MNPVELWGEFSFSKFLFFLDIENIESLPFYLGSSLRGLTGIGMMRTVCPFSHFNCKKCLITEACPYFQLFEKQSNEKHYSVTPKGYTFFPWRWEFREFLKEVYPEVFVESKNSVILEITLFGLCTGFIKTICKSFLTIDAEEIKLGSQRISKVKFLKWAEVLPGGKIEFLDFNLENLRPKGPFPLRDWLAHQPLCAKKVLFLSPLRLRQKGKYLTKFDHSFFFQTLVRRLEVLNLFFNNGSLLGSEKWNKLKDFFANIKVEDQSLRWCDLKRFSNRQKKKIPLGGLIGEVKLKEDLSEDERMWWSCSSLIHVGKGASMGLGKMILLEE